MSHLASRVISECLTPSSVTTSTSPSMNGMEAVEDAYDEQIEMGGISLTKDRSEALDIRLLIVGRSIGLRVGLRKGIKIGCEVVIVDEDCCRGDWITGLRREVVVVERELIGRVPVIGDLSDMRIPRDLLLIANERPCDKLPH